MDCFEIEHFDRKFFGMPIAAAAGNLSARNTFKEAGLQNGSRYRGPAGSEASSSFIADWRQHKPRRKYIITEPDGGYVSDTIRGWRGEKAIGPARSA